MTALSPRLQMVSDMVPHGRPLADIGTDHAYLPANLVLSGAVPSAAAADLREGPLKNAEETIRKCGLEDNIELIHCDGLEDEKLKSYDSFSLAGMGGNLIVDILTASPWIKKFGMHFVLQPQSHAEDVREYLFENGFAILREEAVKDDGHIYVAIECEWTGAKTDFEIADCYIGKLNLSSSPARLEYFRHVAARLKDRRAGIAGYRDEQDEIDILDNIISKIEECIK